jgi:8-oxo-dGTP pyrophosphatase MutT (NUDIX family)
MSELVDILSPPSFEPTGKIMPVYEAIEAGHWLGVMNIWLVRSTGSILYQQRPKNGWEPGKLDGSVGGYYRAGESGLDGMREMQEELGFTVLPEKIDLLGRHLSAGIDSAGRERRLVVTAFISLCDLPFSEFSLDRNEVPAIFEINADDVISSFLSSEYVFSARGINSSGSDINNKFSAVDFSNIFGKYHEKIANISKLYASGKKILYY